MTVYRYPTSIEEAVACLAEHAGEACVIAGGTDLLPDLRKGKTTARCLVDITRITDLRRIEIDDDTVSVGAAVTFSALRQHPYLREYVHALVEGASSVGAGGIQNAATWVGNIVQAMPAADGAIVAVALDAEAEIVRGDGARWEPVESLFEGPGVSAVDPRRELVTRIRFPRPSPGTGTAWRRVGRRRALVLPILNCAVRVTLGQGPARAAPPDGASGDDPDLKVADVAIALGPVAPRPFRAREAETFLEGRRPSPEFLQRAGEVARAEANPRTSIMRASREYRLEILPALVSEALEEAVRRARRSRAPASGGTSGAAEGPRRRGGPQPPSEGEGR